MNKKNIATILILIILTIAISGCSSTRNTTETKTGITHKVRQSSPEEVLVNEIKDGKIVEVYDEYVRLKKGNSADNWIIISNVKDNKETFKILPCSQCEFDSESATIETGKYEIIRFTVAADPGAKEIRVKDSKNNAYGYAKINVIIE